MDVKVFMFVVKDALYTGLPLIYETVLTTMHKANVLYHQRIRACCSCKLERSGRGASCRADTCWCVGSDPPDLRRSSQVLASYSSTHRGIQERTPRSLPARELRSGPRR